MRNGRCLTVLILFKWCPFGDKLQPGASSQFFQLKYSIDVNHGVNQRPNSRLLRLVP